MKGLSLDRISIDQCFKNRPWLSLVRWQHGPRTQQVGGKSEGAKVRGWQWCFCQCFGKAGDWQDPCSEALFCWIVMLCFLPDCSWEWLNITVLAGWELGRGEVIYPKTPCVDNSWTRGRKSWSLSPVDDKKLICNPQSGSDVLILYLATIFCNLLNRKLESTNVRTFDFHPFHSQSLLSTTSCVPDVQVLSPHYAILINLNQNQTNLHFPGEWSSSHQRIVPS